MTKVKMWSSLLNEDLVWRGTLYELIPEYSCILSTFFLYQEGNWEFIYLYNHTKGFISLDRSVERYYLKKIGNRFNEETN